MKYFNESSFQITSEMSTFDESVHVRNIKLMEGLTLTAGNDNSNEITQPNDNTQRSSDSGCKKGSDYDELNIDGSYEMHKIVKVPEDASSLFNSLSYLVYGNTSQGSLIRFFIVEHIGNNWNNFKNYAISPDGKLRFFTKEEYMTEMMKSTTYGGGCELIAAGSIFPFCFEVYVDGTRFSIFGDSKRPIRRLRSIGGAQNHYDAYEPNEEIDLSVNKNGEKGVKREVDCEKKSPSKSPSKNECKKVWKKKLKIEENPFATVWLGDNNGSGCSSEVKKTNSIYVPTKASKKEIIQSRIEEFSNEGNQIEKSPQESSVPDNLIAVDATIKNLGAQAKRGRPKGRKNSMTVWDESKAMCKIHVPRDSLISGPVKKRRGRPRKIPLEAENGSLENSVVDLSNKKISDNFIVEGDCPENCECSQCNKDHSILEKVVKKRGRPKIHREVVETVETVKRPRGRPRKEIKPEDNLTSSLDTTEEIPNESEENLEEKTELQSTKRKRGRPKKIIEPEEPPETTPEWDSFVAPLLNQNIIPLPLPGFTKPSDIPVRFKGESILNNDSENPIEPKIKRPRGRPRKEENITATDTTEKSIDEDCGEEKTEVIKVKRGRGRPRKILENSQTDIEATSEGDQGPSCSGTPEVVKRPRGRPPKKIRTIESAKEDGEKLENDFCDGEDSEDPLVSKSKIPRIKILLKDSIVTVNKQFEVSLEPGSSELIKRPRGRPKKIYSLPPIYIFKKKLDKTSEEI